MSLESLGAQLEEAPLAVRMRKRMIQTKHGILSTVSTEEAKLDTQTYHKIVGENIADRNVAFSKHAKRATWSAKQRM